MEKDFDALIAFLEFPEEEWVSLRATNGIERLNKDAGGRRPLHRGRSPWGYTGGSSTPRGVRGD